MDGKGRAFDNIFVERLWRTVKHENVYLRGYESERECKAGLNDCIAFYNGYIFQKGLPHRGRMTEYPTKKLIFLCSENKTTSGTD